MPPRVGQIIHGKYRLLRLIGEGGMGSVFEAKHEYLGSRVALKFLNPELAANPSLVQRFLREGRVSATIQSPHVVKVSDVDQTEDGVPFLVMELLQGYSLSEMMERQSPLALNQALDFAVQILNGLIAAHSRGVVHRDLKPDNVFLVPMAQGYLVKLLDFGIAKLKLSDEVRKGLTAPGVFMGTPAYMAPEQMFSADTAEPRSDLFSLSVILFEMIAGRRPFPGDDPQQVVAAIIARDRPDLDQLNPQVPHEVAQVVHRCLAADPTERIASAQEYRQALLPFFEPSVFAKGLTTMQDIVPTPVAPVEPVGNAPDAGLNKGGTVPGDATDLPSTTPQRLDSTAPGDQPSATVMGQAGDVVQRMGGGTGTVVGDVPPPPGVAPPPYDAGWSPVAPTADMPPVAPTQPSAPASSARSGGVFKWIALAVVLALVAGAGVLLALLRPWEPEDLPPEPIDFADAGAAMQQPDAPDTVDLPDGSLELPPSSPTTKPHPHQQRDAAALPPMPSTLPPLPSTLPPMPSTLPPLPSTLPPMPSTLPPLPSGFPIQIPGLTPPPN